ncbi:MAG: hypothetical protein R3E95_01410 [Thiolinea sp.]
MYSAGANLFARDQDYFAALTYVYSLTDMKASDQVNSSYAIIPVVGKKTPIGAVSVGLRYQHAERDYQGTLTIPALGNASVNTTLSAENTEKLSYIAGFNTELGRDVYLQQFPVIEKVLYNQSPRKTAAVQNHATETVPLTPTGLLAVPEDLVDPGAAGAYSGVF